jgi:hypothetical protein
MVPQKPGDKMDELNKLMASGGAREELLQQVKRGADSLRQAIQGVSSV